ncbi:MAG TPA: YceI family protein [Flavobacteriales bacterium]
MKITQILSMALVAGAVAMTSCSEAPKTPAPTETNASNAWAGKVNVNVDNAASIVSWKGEMIGGLYGHKGTVALKESSLELTDGKVSGGSFTIDLNTIQATDDNYNPKEGKTPENLIGHLTTPDFFDVANYPTASFVITSVEGDKAKGNLTVRGVTNEETIENIVVTTNGDDVKITGKLTFDRQKYGVAYSTGSKDVILSDDIEINVELNGKK